RGPARLRQVGDRALGQGRAARRDRGIGITRTHLSESVQLVPRTTGGDWHRPPPSLTFAPQTRRPRSTTNGGSAMKRPDARMLGLLAASIAVAATAVAATAAAQERYPARPIRLVIPSVPAGVHDVIGRVWAEKVKPQVGTIVIDNRGGGGGLIGAHDVAHAQPHGYRIPPGSPTPPAPLTPPMANPPPGPA